MPNKKKGKLKAKVKKVAQKIKNKFRETVTKDTTRPVVNGLLKMKKGGKFPDLNKDGKITQADILKGRKVYGKGGFIQYD